METSPPVCRITLFQLWFFLFGLLVPPLKVCHSAPGNQFNPTRIRPPFDFNRLDGLRRLFWGKPPPWVTREGTSSIEVRPACLPFFQSVAFVLSFSCFMPSVSPPPTHSGSFQFVPGHCRTVSDPPPVAQPFVLPWCMTSVTRWASRFFQGSFCAKKQSSVLVLLLVFRHKLTILSNIFFPPFPLCCVWFLIPISFWGPVRFMALHYDPWTPHDTTLCLYTFHATAETGGRLFFLCFQYKRGGPLCLGSLPRR